MKGTIFAKPLELSLETQGESWIQGSTINGMMKIKNHSADKISLSDFAINLNLGDIKKVHAKDAKAFMSISTVKLNENEISGNGEVSTTFSFNIDSNSPVTDKKESLFICYGNQANFGHLMLNITPQSIFVKINQFMTTFFNFKLKGSKNTKNGVEFKFDAPESKDYALVEQLLLTMRTDEEANLHMVFSFEVKAMDLGSVTTKFKKESKKFSKTMKKTDYLMGKDLPNQDKILKVIEEVISEVKGKGLV